MPMSDSDSDGGETTLGSPGSPPESLSPFFWAVGGAQSGPVAGQLQAEGQGADCWRLARLSDVCAFMESAASLSPPVAGGGGAVTAATTGAAGKPTARKTLLLSPASQLDVLSQISEMAERDLREARSSPAQAGPAPPVAGRPHVWSSAQRRRKKRSAATTEADDEAVEDGGSLVALLVGGTKKRRTTHAPQSQHSDKLEADMLDWETCSEDLFLGHDDASDDAWKFEDVSDSDFE